MMRAGWFSQALRALFPPVFCENVELTHKECLARHVIASEMERQAAQRLSAILDQHQRPLALS